MCQSPSTGGRRRGDINELWVNCRVSDREEPTTEQDLSDIKAARVWSDGE